MRNFDLLAKLIWEKQKVRLDPHCWSGKKLGNPKTKMKGGVRVNNCVPKENKINENTLPDTPPFGFFILNNGRVIVIPDVKDEQKVVLSVWPNTRSLEVYRDTGAIKMVYEGSKFLLLYSNRTVSETALTVAKSVADFYNIPIVDINTLKESRFQVTGEIIFKNPNGTGPKHQYVNTIINAASEGQAVLLAAKTVANQKKFGNSYYHVGRGYKVERLPDVEPPAPRLPYRDDE